MSDSEQPDRPEQPEKKGSVRSYIDDYAANWRDSDLPLWEKLAVAAKNRTKAYTVGRGCCGHPGQPGC